MTPTEALAQQRSLPRCAPEKIGDGVVARAIDGRSLALTDGREIILAGIEAPPSPAGLATLAVDQAVILRRAERENDRYGRIPAFVSRVGSDRMIQQDLLARGEARVSARVGDLACANVLLVAERAARSATLGLWSDPYYEIRHAERGGDLLAQRGLFAVVDGKILSVRESAGTIYMNFGRRWSQALTVTILKRNERNFAEAGIEPKTLENRHVRVRGWIEERNGPRIDASRPEQIEIAEQN